MVRTTRKALAMALACGAAASIANAQSCLSTTFANNNGGAGLWTLYFDATINVPINVETLAVNTSTAAGSGIGVTVYLTAPGGTHVGNTSNPGVWTQVSTGTGTSAGVGLPSNIDVTDFFIAPGTYGVAIRYDASTTPVYTNGTGANQTVSNADLTLNLGQSQATTTAPFTGGTPFTPRVWNGTICYSIGGVVGACCLPSTLSCVQTTSTACASQGGTYNGDGSLCATANCPTPGACCLPDGTCIQTTSANCMTQNGTYNGNSSACGSIMCPQPPSGSCCLPDGTCISATSFACTPQNGIWGGAGSACGTANCAKGFVFVGGPIPIADGTGSTACGVPAVASVTVAQSFPITGIEAAYFISHTFQGDLRVTLSKTAGPSVTMVDRPGVAAPGQFGFGNDNYGASNTNAGYFISNETAVNIYDTPAVAAPGTTNVIGRWKSENTMAPFIGVDSAGTWNLSVEDCAGADTGNLVGFVLLLKMAPMGGGCYANCDASTIVPFLNVNDFICFNNLFAAGDTNANCDGSTIVPVLNVNDFICFNNAFASGCSAP